MIVQIKDRQEILQFLNRIQQQGCRSPMLLTAEQVERNLLQELWSPCDLVLGVYRENRLQAVFSLLVELQERYLELLAALTHDREDCAQVLAYLTECYPGFALDCVLHPEHSAMIQALEEFGGVFYPVQVRMSLAERVSATKDRRIVPLEERYRAGYFAIHTTDVYWTAERVMAAEETFRVLLALRGEEVVGYVDYTHSHEENEIYDLFVRPDCRRRGIGLALLTAAVEAGAPKGMVLMVDEDNEEALRLCRRAGFRQIEGGHSLTAHLVLGQTPQVRQLFDPDEKRKVAATILSGLSDWFGMPEYTENYIRESGQMPFWVAGDLDAPQGFIAMKETSRYTAEVYVMGVRKDCHRKGLGRRLYMALETWAKAQGYAFCQVKTVKTGCYPEYDRTNAFYQAMGFRELECFPTLWDAWNPCQIYVKAIG